MIDGLKSVFTMLILFLVIPSCRDDQPNFSLPPITQEGRNTLGFLVDGKVWVNYGDICNWFACEENYVTSRLHKYSNSTYSIIIEAKHNNMEEKIWQEFQIVVENVSSAGSFSLDNQSNDQMSFVENHSNNIFFQL